MKILSEYREVKITRILDDNILSCRINMRRIRETTWR